MKRELKFRAWEKRTKKMRSWSYIVNNRMLTSTIMNGCRGKLEVMQYTGIKDKDGTEIYEGDVLAIPRVGKNDEVIGTVVYDEFAAFILEKENGGWEYLGTSILEYNNLYVIDNIYENPELLKSNLTKDKK